VFGRRLQQARTMRELSLRGLSEALKGVVSHNALAKYEGGLMMPGSKVLIALAEVLGQPMDFFFRPFQVELKEVRFRRKSRLGAKRRQAIQEQAADFIERYHEIEQITGEVRRFEPVLKKHTVRTPEDTEALADLLRQEWSLGTDALPNVQELLEDKGIKVFELDTDDTDFDGLSAETDAGDVVVLASHLRNNQLRKRMTEVHELAHIALPIASGLEESQEEAIVRRFAGAFLMPATSFREAFGPHRTSLSLGELINLKAQFGASIMAIMKRAQQLKLISDADFQGFSIYASKKGWRSGKEEDGQDAWKGVEQNFRFERLVMRAVAEDKISAAKGAALLNKSLDELRALLQEVVA
jgi:Zn-dependent peptidase ImmA (M78 family)/transcriptional regulator with XRE-family HTH domain